MGAAPEGWIYDFKIPSSEEKGRSKWVAPVKKWTAFNERGFQ
jgi:hypothetical protein